MAPQFQRPDFLLQQPTKTEALVNPVSQTIQTLPELYASYKMRRKEQELKDLELEMKKREFQSRFGTGINESIKEGQLLSAPSPTAGPEEQLYGFEATMPTLGTETPDQQLRRQGTEGFNAQTSRIKAETEKPARSQLKVTDKNVPILFDPVSNTLVVQATGEPYDPASHGNIVVAGAPPLLPPNQNVEITDITAARKQLRGLVAGAEEAGFGDGNPYLEKARASKMNPLQLLDPKVQKLKQLVKATKQIIGKGLEGGVLRKEDEEKYDDIIPKLGDTKEILIGKSRQLDQLLAQKQEERAKGFNQAGYRGVPQGEAMSPIGGQPKGAQQDTIVDTQEEYDALPSGSVYIDSNGKRARKR